MHRTSNAPAGSGEGAVDRQLSGDGSQINSCGGEAQARLVYILKLEPLPGIDGAHALRELLKQAGRSHGLHCLACHELSPPASAQPAPEGLLDRRAAWLAEAERRRGGQ
jgi:hypothetical protein